MLSSKIDRAGTNLLDPNIYTSREPLNTEVLRDLLQPIIPVANDSSCCEQCARLSEDTTLANMEKDLK